MVEGHEGGELTSSSTSTTTSYPALLLDILCIFLRSSPRRSQMPISARIIPFLAWLYALRIRDCDIRFPSMELDEQLGQLSPALRAANKEVRAL